MDVSLKAIYRLHFLSRVFYDLQGGMLLAKPISTYLAPAFTLPPANRRPSNVELLYSANGVSFFLSHL